METLDTITIAQWRGMTEEERRHFINYWAEKGFVAYSCLCCGYPGPHRGNCTTESKHQEAK